MTRDRPDRGLAEAYRHLKIVLEHAPITIFSFDDRGVFLSFEGRRVDEAGRERDAIVGASVFERYRDHPWITDSAQRALTGEAVSVIGEFQGAWYETHYVPIRGPEGDVTGVLGISIDVTVRKRAQDALDQQQAVLKYVIANVPHAIFWKDREGRFLGGNQHFLTDSGAMVLDNLVGKTDHELWGRPEDADFFVQVDRQVMVSGQSILDIEEPLLRSDGQQRVLLTSKVPIRNEGGDVTGLLGIYADITERKQMEMELQKAKEAADTAARAKGEFLTMMSHELRTPLALILGPLTSLLSREEGALSPQLRTDLERIQRNARRLHRLVDDILDHQKIEAGKMAVDWEAVEAAQLCADIVDAARAAAERGGIALSIEVDPGVGSVPLDRRKFEKILLNLLGNAIKFTPPGGRVTVALRAANGHVELSVEDTGPGIAADKQHLLFQRFQQLDSSATRKHEGTGIGLSLVKELTELMGGRVSVTSEPGKGARFVVRLPRLADDLAAPAPQSGVAQAGEGYFAEPAPIAEGTRGTAGQATGHATRVLVAEDNPDMRSYLASILAPEYDVELVSNGREALASVGASRPDVIVSDVMMPEMDGFELVRRLKQDAALRDIPVILLTARASRQETVSGLEGGADDYLGKPFDPEELKARVRAAERLHRAYLEIAAKSEELAATLRQLSEMQQELIEAGKMAAVGTLVAGLSHELNNPIAVIQMKAQLLRRQPREALDGMLDKTLGTIEVHAKRCSELVRSLLEYSRKKPATKELCDVRASLARALDIAAPQAGARDVRLEVPDQARAGAMSLVNRTQLDSALLNVINNAIDAAAGGGAVTVTAGAIERRGVPGVEIEVHDTGRGISAEDLPHIFEPFFTTKPPGQGTGLGLSMTRRFFDEHAGEIRVESEGGRGTTVRMWLPTTEAEADRATQGAT